MGGAEMKTDTEILGWLEKNMDYFEHGGRSLGDGYWPQSANPESPYFGLSLREYIETRMEESK
jgi:hypothetical protein